MNDREMADVEMTLAAENGRGDLTDHDDEENSIRRSRLRRSVSFVATWVVLISLLTADLLIQLMLLIRSNERRIRPTKRQPWPEGLKRRLMRRQDSTCTYCGHRRAAYSMEIDHMVPVVKGGSNDIGNLQVICRQCNLRKGQQTDKEFRARHARLVPAGQLTPPRRRISQREFAAATRRTREVASARRFRRTRFISKGEKVSSGCLVLGFAVAILTGWALASLGADGLLLALPVATLGVATGGGVWLRAYGTGAMIEDNG